MTLKRIRAFKVLGVLGYHNFNLIREYTDHYDPIELISPAEARMLYRQHEPTATKITRDRYGWEMTFDTVTKDSTKVLESGG